MIIAPMVRRSIAILAVTGSLLAGGVVIASESQAANVRLGTVLFPRDNLQGDDRVLQDYAYSQCVKKYGDIVRGARLREIQVVGDPLGFHKFAYIYVCWAR